MSAGDDGSARADASAVDGVARFGADFAEELRVRGVSVRRAATLSGWGKSTISAAARGESLPNVDMVVDVLSAVGVDACDLAAWRVRHAQLDRARRPRPVRPLAAVPPDPAPPGRVRRRVLLGVAAVVLVAASGVVVFLVARGAAGPAPTGGRLVTVQNMVAIGPTSLIEDSTPSYLARLPVARCAARPGCRVEGTDVFSGDVLRVVCRREGAVLTNADLSSPGIGSNPAAVTSGLWYGAIRPDGQRGFISEVYLVPGDRGGLDLPPCRPEF